MFIKRFHSRRSYRSLAFWGALGAVLALLGLLSLDITGSDALLIVAGGLVVLCIIAAVVTSKREIIEYELNADTIMLRRGLNEDELLLNDVMDANLIDLMTAKDYVQQHTDPASGTDGINNVEDRGMLTRYCGVPLGGIAAFKTGISRLNAQNFRRTLVLLRIRDGGAVILSPKYSESMVSAVGRALDVSRRDGQAGTSSTDAQVLPNAQGAA